jgi:hypothetical protein
MCIFVHICGYSFHVCYARLNAYPNHMHIKIIVKKTTCGGKKERKATAQIGTNVRARVFNTGLLTRSQFASGRSCDRPTRSRFSVVFLSSFVVFLPWFSQSKCWVGTKIPRCTAWFSCSPPNGNIKKFRPKLTRLWLLTLGWTTLFMGDMGEGALHEERKSLSNKEN